MLPLENQVPCFVRTASSLGARNTITNQCTNDNTTSKQYTHNRTSISNLVLKIGKLKLRFSPSPHPEGAKYMGGYFAKGGDGVCSPNAQSPLNQYGCKLRVATQQMSLSKHGMLSGFIPAPLCFVAALPLVPNEARSRINAGPAVAATRPWLRQGGRQNANLFEI